jgi:hypothetical protein
MLLLMLMLMLICVLYAEMIPFHDITTSCVMAFTNEHCFGSKVPTVRWVWLSIRFPPRRSCLVFCVCLCIPFFAFVFLFCCLRLRLRLCLCRCVFVFVLFCFVLSCLAPYAHLNLLSVCLAALRVMDCSFKC